MYEYQAKLIRVVDGDTVDLMVDMGCRIYNEMRCRLYGINAPERNTEDGPEATEFLLGLLSSATTITIETYKDRKEKYGRFLARIFVDGNTVSVNEIMVESRHAVRYMD